MAGVNGAFVSWRVVPLSWPMNVVPTTYETLEYLFAGSSLLFNGEQKAPISADTKWSKPRNMYITEEPFLYEY